MIGHQNALFDRAHCRFARKAEAPAQLAAATPSGAKAVAYDALTLRDQRISLLFSIDQ